MKKKIRRVTSVLLTLALAFSCVGFSASAQTTDLSPDEQYIALMEATDWGLYDNHAINVQRAQIPDYLLNQMTTEQLVNAVLNYPYLGDILCYDKFSDGFQIVAKYYNGLSELISREDSAQILLEYIETISVQGLTSLDDKDIVKRGVYLDVLLAQPEFMNQFTQEETEAVIAVVDENIDNRLMKTDTYSDWSTYMFYRVVNEDIEAYLYRTTVITPAGSSVSVIAREEPAMTPEEQDIYRDIARQYSSAQIIGTPNRNYNCHSYAWYSQSQSNPYWMEDPSTYMNDGSYRKISDFQRNAKIYYGNATLGKHSGVCYTEGRVYSKWGAGCLVLHKWMNCPYYNAATPVSYWILA